MAAKGASKASRTQTISCQFERGASQFVHCPLETGSEVAFVGRSNAGKSSTLNRIAGQRIARVSKTPGRTQEINFFTTSMPGRLVDLPGYGYARAGKAQRLAWGRTVDDYLNKRNALQLVVIVTDARHPPMPLDVAMMNWCAEKPVATLVLLNKADLLKQGERHRALDRLRKALPGERDGKKDEQFDAMLFSAVSGLGADKVVARLREVLSGEMMSL